MSYSVLARKWRPKSLQEMVGQEHILTIITNSILQNRLHHAYLFCGTRGVGKTTLARIFTKCLNCETGPTALPCNQCHTCRQIDKGNYADLIEIDAASRTKVEDTRELLDNVQYAATSGKYKVYLIDEVHMLSGHSFNALLKTLEEPPEHVKFILATTDPQKLPITVLSRCLKLSLKILTVPQISAHLAQVLTSENIAFEPAALQEIAQAAQGSMRDGLSLLDQAIVFCNSTITLEKVNALLGTETKHLNVILLELLIDKETNEIFPLIQTMEEKNADFLRVTDDLLDLLHHIMLYQKNPHLISQDDARLQQAIPRLSKKLAAEDGQLLYQIGLSGKRDLPFAPTLKVGFEMLILRALDFYPLKLAEDETIASLSNEKHQTKPSATLPEVVPEVTAATWPSIVSQANFSGMTLTLANQVSIGKMVNNKLELTLPQRHRALCNEKQRQLLAGAVTRYIGHLVVVDFNFAPENVGEITPPLATQKQGKVTKKEANATSNQQTHLQQLLEMFDANIQQTSIEE